MTPLPLPEGIRSRIIPDINGLHMHILEAGHDTPGRRCVLLLHGFPELAYSWRKIMLPLAAAGFHVVAPDQRGYGRTIGWSADYDADLRPFRLLNAVRDAIGLVSALGHRSVAAVIGHDFGAPVAAWSALVRPDFFRSVVMMSAPFPGPPALPFDTANTPPSPPPPDIHAALAALDRPRKHYQRDHSTRPANADMHACKQGVHDFLRAYFHYKSADWPGNKPFPLQSWSASELEKLPTYYLMDRDQDMAETVAPLMPSPAHIAACHWLPEQDMRVFSEEYRRTGFQGGLNWYRCRTENIDTADLQLFSGRSIDVRSLFIAGASDWGIYQSPGAIDRMQTSACTRMVGCHLVEGAGHWVQQEQPDRVAHLLAGFLAAHA